MYFEKDNNKINHKITFSITLAIILLATSSVSAISFSSIVTKEAFGQNTYNPVKDCFDQNGSPQDQSYQDSRTNFDLAIPSDQVFVSLAKTYNLPMQGTADLSKLIATNYSADDGEKLFNEISNLLSSSGFTTDQQNNLYQCFLNLAPG